jgi:hypothetical protein
LEKPQDRGGNQLFYTKSQELHSLWDTKLVVKVVTSTSFEQLAGKLKEVPLPASTSESYRAWPIKWVEDSEKVAIGAYDGLQFKAAKLAWDGSIDRIDITFPGGNVPAEVSQVQIQLRKAAVHLAQLLNVSHY